MASFSRRKEWCAAKCAFFSARREYERVVLYSTADPKIVAMVQAMGYVAAVQAPGGQRSAAAPIRPARARRQPSGEPDSGQAVPLHRSKRAKRTQRERRQRQEAASKCRAIVRSYLVRKVCMPVARERAAARAIADSFLEASSPSPAPASEWEVVVARRGRRSRSQTPPAQQSWEAVDVGGCTTMTPVPSPPVLGEPLPPPEPAVGNLAKDSGLRPVTGLRSVYIISTCALYSNRATEHAYRFLLRRLSEDAFKSDCVVNAGCKLCANKKITELD